MGVAAAVTATAPLAKTATEAAAVMAGMAAAAPGARVTAVAMATAISPTPCRITRRIPDYMIRH